MKPSCLQIIMLFCTSIVLISCTSPEQAAARRAAVERADNLECANLGFTQGTESFGNCRLKLREIRATENSINNRPYFYPSIGIGYSHHR